MLEEAAPAEAPRRPSLVESLSGIAYYVADAVAPYPAAHGEGRRASRRASEEIVAHVDNVLRAVTHAIAPPGGDGGEGGGGGGKGGTHHDDDGGGGGGVIRRLFGGGGGGGGADDGAGAATPPPGPAPAPAPPPLQRAVFDAVADTRRCYVAYTSGSEDTDFVDDFFKLLATPAPDFGPADWARLDGMLAVEPNLLWRRATTADWTHLLFNRNRKREQFEESFTPLHCAASVGHAALCARLLRVEGEGAGADPTAVDRFGRQALHVAAYEGHADVCVVLSAALAARDPDGAAPVGPRAPVDVCGWTPAIYSVLGLKQKRRDNGAWRGHDPASDPSEAALQEKIAAAAAELGALKQRYKGGELPKAEYRSALNATTDRRKALQQMEKSAKFGRCKALLYQHGDLHVSPRSDKKQQQQQQQQQRNSHGGATVGAGSSPRVGSPLVANAAAAGSMSPLGDRGGGRPPLPAAGRPGSRLAGRHHHYVAGSSSPTGRLSDSPLRSKVHYYRRRMAGLDSKRNGGGTAPLPRGSPLVPTTAVATAAAAAAAAAAATTSSAHPS